MHNPVEKTSPTTQSCGDTLRQLPAELQPPYHWQEFQRRAYLRSETQHRLDWRYVTAAAALLLVVCGIAIWGRIDSGRRVLADSGSSTQGPEYRTPGPAGAEGDIDALREVQSGWGDADASPAGHDASSSEVALAVSRSRAIESWLATLPREPAVVRVGTRAAVARLEDNIAQVDDLLTAVRLDGRQPDRLVALQRERVRLVGSLAQVRYAEVLASESP
jgi:hypothetical protein